VITADRLGLKQNEVRALQWVTGGTQKSCVTPAGVEAVRIDNPWKLTPMQALVMDFVCEGMVSKQIGPALGISAKTVEVHRSRVMQRMGVVTPIRAAVLWDRHRRDTRSSGGTAEPHRSTP